MKKNINKTKLFLKDTKHKSTNFILKNWVLIILTIFAGYCFTYEYNLILDLIIYKEDLAHIGLPTKILVLSVPIIVGIGCLAFVGFKIKKTSNTDSPKKMYLNDFVNNFFYMPEDIEKKSFSSILQFKSFEEYKLFKNYYQNEKNLIQQKNYFKQVRKLNSNSSYNSYKTLCCANDFMIINILREYNKFRPLEKVFVVDVSKVGMLFNKEGKQDKTSLKKFIKLPLNKKEYLETFFLTLFDYETYSLTQDREKYNILTIEYIIKKSIKENHSFENENGFFDIDFLVKRYLNELTKKGLSKP